MNWKHSSLASQLIRVSFRSMKPQSIRITLACMFAGMSLMMSSAFAAEPAKPEKTGLEVGKKAPEGVAARDRVRLVWIVPGVCRSTKKHFWTPPNVVLE